MSSRSWPRRGRSPAKAEASGANGARGDDDGGPAPGPDAARMALGRAVFDSPHARSWVEGAIALAVSLRVATALAAAHEPCWLEAAALVAITTTGLALDSSAASRLDGRASGPIRPRVGVPPGLALGASAALWATGATLATGTCPGALFAFWGAGVSASGLLTAVAAGHGGTHGPLSWTAGAAAAACVSVVAAVLRWGMADPAAGLATSAALVAVAISTGVILRAVLTSLPRSATVAEAALAAVAVALTSVDAVMHLIARCAPDLALPSPWSALRSPEALALQAMILAPLAAAVAAAWAVGPSWPLWPPVAGLPSPSPPSPGLPPMLPGSTALAMLLLAGAAVVAALIWMVACSAGVTPLSLAAWPTDMAAPLLWLCSFLAATPLRVALVIYWAASLAGALAALCAPRTAQSPPRILVRKAFHVLAACLFLPAALVDATLLRVALGGAFAAMATLEAARALRVPVVAAAVQRWMSPFADGRDGGPLLASHFTLLLGMAAPLWLSPGGGASSPGFAAGRAVAMGSIGALGPLPLAALAGIVALGVGDVAAAAVGHRDGRTRLMAGCPKTLEGTAAGAMSMLVACAVLALVVSPGTAIPWASIAGASVAAAALEAATAQLDNLFVPLCLYALLALA